MLKSKSPLFPHLRRIPHLHSSCERHRCLYNRSVSEPASPHADAYLLGSCGNVPITAMLFCLHVVGRLAGY